MDAQWQSCVMHNYRRKVCIKYHIMHEVLENFSNEINHEYQWWKE